MEPQATPEFVIGQMRVLTMSAQTFFYVVNRPIPFTDLDQDLANRGLHPGIGGTADRSSAARPLDHRRRHERLGRERVRVADLGLDLGHGAADVIGQLGCGHGNLLGHPSPSGAWASRRRPRGNVARPR